MGVAPGRPGDSDRRRLERGRAARPPAGALVERFSETEQLDLVSAVRRFLAGRADVFQQVVVYTTRPLNPVPGTLAFEINVRNDVRGIGLEIDGPRARVGQRGRAGERRLHGLRRHLRGRATASRSSPTRSAIAGWRGCASDGDGAAPRPGLLGRGGVHWSFFLDTDASVMEGNDIADRGDGRFETVDFARRFSPLDQYAMGLRAAAEVPPFFYVDVPDDFRPNRPFKASSAPEAGVSFTGVRRDVRIEDVVRAMGPRVPATGPPRLSPGVRAGRRRRRARDRGPGAHRGPHPVPVRALFHRGHGRPGRRRLDPALTAGVPRVLPYTAVVGRRSAPGRPETR